jgi:hypothetical protein
MGCFATCFAFSQWLTAGLLIHHFHQPHFLKKQQQHQQICAKIEPTVCCFSAQRHTQENGERKKIISLKKIIGATMANSVHTNTHTHIHIVFLFCLPLCRIKKMAKNMKKNKPILMLGKRRPHMQCRVHFDLLFESGIMGLDSA